MYANKVEICGVNTADLKTIKESEKIRLIKLAKEGDDKAREELINSNLRLVLSVIQRFMSRGENPDDLFQVGCIGLIKAIDNFDCGHGVRFSTYAVPMIIGEVRRYLRDNMTMRVSRSMKDTAYKAMQIKEELTAKNMREPTIEEIAKHQGVSKHEIVIALEAIIEPVSLYEAVYSDGGDTIMIMDQIGSKQDDESWLEEILIKDGILKLSAREKHILSLRYLKGMTQVEVSRKIGISQAQVSRLEKNAVEKIKNSENL